MVVVATLVGGLGAGRLATPACPAHVVRQPAGRVRERPHRVEALRSARVTIALVPGHHAGGARRDQGMAVGLLSAGMGTVPPAQTYLDVGAGRPRPGPALPVEPLPPIRARVAPGRRGEDPGFDLGPGPRPRRPTRRRDLVAGAAWSRRSGQAASPLAPMRRGAPAAMIVDEGGRLASPRGCASQLPGACGSPGSRAWARLARRPPAFAPTTC